MEELGFHLHSANFDVKFPKSAGISLTHTLGKGISWSTDLPFTMPVFLPDDTSWNLKIKRGSDTWTSPPLVIQPVTGDVGIGIGRKGNLGGIDRTTYLLSRLATDKPTYSKTTASAIINDLAGDVGVTVTGAPTYSVYEYDAHEGSIISHITALLRKGGKTFYIGSTGDLVCVDMDVATTNSYGTSWISNISWAYDPTAKKSRKRFIKTSKIKTAYDFRWTEAGSGKSGSFDALMRGVQVIDESIVGYIDEVGLYDASSLQVGPVILFHPDEHTGATYSPSESSDPVSSFLLTVHPPHDNTDATDIDARARFVGILDDDASGYDISFDATETPSALFNYYARQACRCHYAYGTDSDATCDFEKISNNIGTWYYRSGLYLESTDELLRTFRYDAFGSFEDLDAGTTYTCEEADRPADTTDYEDCITMPTLTHCNSVKKPITYEEIKRQYSVTYTGPKVLFELLPGVKIEYSRQPDAVVNSVTISQKGVKAVCHPELWW
ncbi:MAG: hypothetical protein AB2L14_25270 [Candidatus Xenobiia bacterium LiM19]